MANQYTNKVIYGGETLIDLTGDNAEASDVLSGKAFHLRSGAPATGTCTYDADTGDATAAAAEILTGKTAYVAGSKVTGSMPNRGSATGTITTKAQQYTIANGYHDGGGKVSISATEQAKIIAGNIKAGVTILGVEGTMTGKDDMVLQTKSATPRTTSQTILPDTGYDGLSQVNVAAIPVTRTDNAQGGVTVAIASS